MREQPKVISLEQYRYRRYYQNQQKERAIYLAAFFTEVRHQEEEGEEKEDEK